jgi:hypothetical protein
MFYIMYILGCFTKNFSRLRGCRGRDCMVVEFTTLCNQCLLPLALWVQIPLRRGVLNTTLCVKSFADGQLFPPPIKGPPWYYWNIVESGGKHHNLYPYILIVWLCLYCGIILTINITNMNFNVEVCFVCFM